MKKTLILVLFAFSLIQSSNAVQAQESLQDAVQREKMLEEQGNQSVLASQQRVNQIQQPIYQHISENWNDQQRRFNQLAIQHKALESLPAFTPSEITKAKQDWAIYKIFEFSFLILGVLSIIFMFLLHIPNRLIDQDRWKDVGLVNAIRKGMSQASYNESNFKILLIEMMVVALMLGIFYKSLWVFAGAIIATGFLLSYRKSGLLIVFMFSLFWGLLAAQFGYNAIGGQFLTPGNYILAWVGGYLFAAAGFWLALSVHVSGLQYFQDLS